MNRAIIIGASSGMGRQISQLLIQDGWTVGLGARRTELLEPIRQMAPDRVVTAHVDVDTEDAVGELSDLISRTGGMSLFVYAAGIGKKNVDLEASVEMNTVRTNAAGFTRMTGEAFRYFTRSAGGHIVVISSIAGTKGLGPAPSYSATKAFQNTYIEALEQLATSRHLNIRFTDIRPGFVDTPLIKGSRYPMTLSTAYAVKHIMRAIQHKRHVAYIDWRWHIVVMFWRMIPRFLWRRLLSGYFG